MTDAELVEMRERGFEIGSHGHRHVDLSHAGEQEVRDDLRASVSRLQTALGQAPRFLSWPYGRSSEVARSAAREAGFAEAFSLEWEEAPFARSRGSRIWRACASATSCTRCWKRRSTGWQVSAASTR